MGSALANRVSISRSRPMARSRSSLNGGGTGTGAGSDTDSDGAGSGGVVRLGRTVSIGCTGLTGRGAGVSTGQYSWSFGISRPPGYQHLRPWISRQYHPARASGFTKHAIATAECVVINIRKQVTASHAHVSGRQRLFIIIHPFAVRVRLWFVFGFLVWQLIGAAAIEQAAGHLS